MFYSIATSEAGDEYLLFAHEYEEYERGEADRPSTVIATLTVEDGAAFRRTLEPLLPVAFLPSASPPPKRRKVLSAILPDPSGNLRKLCTDGKFIAYFSVKDQADRSGMPFSLSNIPYPGCHRVGYQEQARVVAERIREAWSGAETDEDFARHLHRLGVNRYS